jgi:hypothetical protein
MKLIFKCAIPVLILAFSACASSSQKVDYSALAKEQSFDYFFPSSNFAKGFSSLDAAEEYVNTATAKYVQTIAQFKEMGKAGRLKGPAREDDSVVVICFFYASDTGGSINLSEVDKDDLPGVLRRTTGSRLYFCVLCNDRAVVIPSFYTAPGYSYRQNTQPSYYNLSGNRYDADYPSNWGVDKAFSYLRKEIN